MPFLLKQPSVVARMLCASECPDFDVIHDPSRYETFYDPLYSPGDHPALFDSESSACAWLLRGLQHHTVPCQSCTSSTPTVCTSAWKVSYSSETFEINTLNSRVNVSVSYVESRLFSFCRLYRRLLTVITDSEHVFDLSPVVCHAPVWLLRNAHEAYPFLSALSLTELLKCTQKLYLPCQRVKVSVMNTLIDDFIRERDAIVSSNYWSSSTAFLTVSVSQHFVARYGDTVANAFRDLRTISDFNGQHIHLLYSVLYGDTWVTSTFKDMSSKLTSFPKEDVLRCLHGIPSHLRPLYNARSHRSCSTAILRHIRNRIQHLASLSLPNFLRVFFSVQPFSTNSDKSRFHLTDLILCAEYGDDIVSCLRTPSFSANALRSLHRCQDKDERTAQDKKDMDIIRSAWPTVVPDDIVFDCLENYRLHTIWQPPLICCVCGLERRDTSEFDPYSNKCNRSLDFSLLSVKDSYLKDHAEFQYGCKVIDGCILEKKGFKYHDEDKIILQVCNECLTALTRCRIPRLSLANYFYRGKLPKEFEDLTWVEEMVCAKYRNTAHVSRIYGSSDPAQPRVFHGNTCAHEMNVLSTASILPRTCSNINDMLTVVFVGAKKFDPNCLKQMFTVRKKKIWGFLLWLTKHNRLYMDIPLDATIMDSYPDNGLLPGLKDRIFENHIDQHDSDSLFAEETAGFTEHPSQLINGYEQNDSDPPLLMMEKMGVSDVDGFKISGRSSTASALKNLVPYHVPDVVIHHSSHAVIEYNNPDLMPGMFPTLFPLGLGGFEHPLRVPNVSFQAHVNALLDVPDKSFRQHQSFMFIALNILQRRLSHLHTHFTVRKSNFDLVATKLTSLSSDVLCRLASHLESEGSSHVLTAVEQDALGLLRHVNTISARIPGSQSAKIFTRNEIRSYFGEFGLPQLYFTFNPSVTHNPIFQVMVGDQSVDLTSQFPFVVPSKDRALRLAQDPVAAADFFEFCVSSIFEHLFGWDYITRTSSKKGGILGHVQAFYGTCEFTERGSLHAHFLIWLIGGLNPNEIHQLLKEDSDFKRRFFNYFEDIIHHHLPDQDVVIDASYEPRVERPPAPPSSSGKMSVQDIYNWHSFMETEVKKLGEVLQRHRCKPVCHKYGNTDKCRFLFPHEVVSTSYFDSDMNSVDAHGILLYTENDYF